MQSKGSDNERILNRIKSSFTSTYLTIISIIQGAAFAYLGGFVGGYAGKFDVVTWILIANTLLLIIEAWDEYMIGTTTYIWVPNILDALLPFALGGVELFIIHSIGMLSAWLLGTAGLAFLGFLAFANLYVKAKHESAENAGILKAVAPHILTGHLFAILGFVLCLGLWRVALTIGPGSHLLALFGLSLPVWLQQNDQMVIALAASPLILAFFFRSIIYWQAVIAYAEGR